ncbi:SAM-dependent methyltransferase [Salinibacter grassmerensis]|uniref:SAM-dependent methyltransferase n=1 Tax=Salinibacter grassmerensis TaxID=3040353 RepID=UPI0021E9595B|nr:class I SAM-dependent methyltransferase [Salinibacter grassmerensis]
MSKPAAFWNDRFASEEYVYGEAPNRFVASAARTWLPHPEEVLLLGAGEGRNAVHLAREGHTVTAVDYAAEGLRKTERLAREAEVDVERIQADVREWEPVRMWDAVVVTFLHLPADERPGLYRLVQRCVRPGGRLLAEWFRPEQRTDGYTSGGPPDPAMMVTAEELREHFAAAGIEHLEVAEPTLSEGMHQGSAATVRLVWRRPSSS